MNTGTLVRIRRRLSLALLVLQSVGITLIVLLSILSGSETPARLALFVVIALASIAATAAYWRGWTPARFLAVVAFTLVVSLLLPEPFIRTSAPLVLAVPLVLALVLTNARWVAGIGGLQLLILLFRAGGSGVYAHPVTLILYAIIVGGLVLSRVFTEAALSQARSHAHDAEQQQIVARRRAERADALVRSAARLNAPSELATTVAAVCEETTRALGVTTSLLYLLQDGRLELLGGQNPPAELVPAQTLTHADVATLFAHNEPALTLPNLGVLDQNRDPPLGHGGRSAAVARLQRNGQLIGVLAAVTLDAPRVFSGDDLALLRGLADQASLAITNRRLFDDVARHLNNVQALRTIDQAITATHNLEFTLNIVLQQAMLRLNVDAADVLLLNAADQTLVFAASLGFRTEALRHTRLSLGEGYAGQAALQQASIYTADLREAPGPLRRATLLSDEGFVAYCGTPLLVRGQVKGVLEVFHRAPHSNDTEWIEFFETLAGQAAIAIDNAELFEHLSQSNVELIQAYDGTIEGWARALDLRDKETEGHSRRVTEMTLRLARQIGISEDELVHVRRGALLHDIGKMGIPDSILLKAGPLTAGEWETMRRHPAYAYDLLAPIAFLRPALDIPYCHHERWDGAGYPRGLAGQAIPLAARIFAVVDVWDALSSDRPYRPAWPSERVLAHIRSEVGLHFDPLVVAALETTLATAPDA